MDSLMLLDEKTKAYLYCVQTETVMELQDDKTVVFKRKNANIKQVWTIEKQNDGRLHFMSCENMYLCADKGWKVIADRKAPGEWEKWVGVPSEEDDDTFYLFDCGKKRCLKVDEENGIISFVYPTEPRSRFQFVEKH